MGLYGNDLINYVSLNEKIETLSDLEKVGLKINSKVYKVYKQS